MCFLHISLFEVTVKYEYGMGRLHPACCLVLGGWCENHCGDNGCGIEKAQLTKLFERFFRGAEARSKNPDGSGLGLAIARWIAEGHGGSISVHSTLGKGTEFVVRLPVRNARQKNKKLLAQNLNP